MNNRDRLLNQMRILNISTRGVMLTQECKTNILVDWFKQFNVMFRTA